MVATHRKLPVSSGTLQNVSTYENNNKFKSSVTRKVHHFKASANCKTTNVVYVIECTNVQFNMSEK